MKSEETTQVGNLRIRVRKVQLHPYLEALIGSKQNTAMPCQCLSCQQGSLIMGTEAYREASLSRQNDRMPVSCKKALAIIREDIDAEMYCKTALRIISRMG